MTLNVAALNEVSRAFALPTEGLPNFSTPAIERVRQSLRAGLATESDSVMVLVGTSGVGKTLLIQSLLDDLPASWSHKARVNFTLMSPADLLQSVAYAFGMLSTETRAPTEWLRSRLCDWTAREQGCLLVVDEAQGLSPKALGTLLGLSQMRLKNRPLLRIILAGQPELLDLLDAPEAAPFALNLLSLPGFRPSESNAYVRQCLARHGGLRLPALSDTALTAIHQRTQGLPGRINPLCVRIFHTAILRESFEALDAAAVNAEAEELCFHSAPERDTPVVARASRVVQHPSASLREMAMSAPSPAPAPAQPTASAPVLSAPATPPQRRLPVGLLAGLFVGVLACGALFYATRAPNAVAPEKALAQTSPTPHQVTTAAPAPMPAPVTEASELVIHPAAGPQPAPEIAAPAAKPVVVSQGVTPTQAKDEPTRKLCEKLLVQVSLGEPLSTSQKQTLDTQCH